MESDDLLPRLQQHFGGELIIERELGGGGMSRVVLGRDDRLGRRVVVKVLPPGVTASISAERFEREIMLAAAMQHPNIVPVLSAGRIDGLPYFVMPFIEGESLRARMARGPLSVRETVNILKDVTRALQFAHGRGVIHRDIKPDNVLLTTGAGAAVVTDFGVAKALSASASTSGPKLSHVSVTGVGMSPGTPAYMSPEQAAADPATDHRTDLYSLGILGYEMLVGAAPFAGRSPQALLAAQLSEVPPPITSRRYDVPVALDRLLAQCMAKDPAHRPATAAALLRLLEDPEMVSGVFASPPSARRWWHVRGPARAGLAVAALCVIAAVSWIAASAARATGDVAADSTSAPAGAVVPGANRSIVVMPFASLGADTSARQVADAMTSALGVAIARSPGWRVTSTASLRALGDSARAPSVAARALSITHFVDGSVQRERDAVRVSLRLVRAANDSTLWAGTFDGTFDRQLALQDSVSQAVVRAMNAGVR